MIYDFENSIAFNSYNENFVLSNMYPCTLDYKDMTFFGVDHLFFYILFYKYPDIQSKILKFKGVNANFDAKKIAKQNNGLIEHIKPQQRYNLLEKIIRLKYEQCNLFRDEMIRSKGKFLIEFAWWGDTEYGCVLKNGKYEGENVTGKILMKIRDENN